MKNRLPVIASALVLLANVNSHADVKVDINNVDNDDTTPGYSFKTVPPPSKNDAAAGLKFTIVDGEADANSPGVDVLTDGKMATSDDDAGSSFFFKPGPDGGRLEIDLKTAISVKQINTYSWHTDTRAPQVYKVYGSDATAKDFNAAPKKDVDPEKAGWKLIATVDTKPKTGGTGTTGQFGVSISSTDGVVGKYRYLLFDVSVTGMDANFGNTFYNEIDVVDANGPAAVAAVEKVVTLPDFVIKSPDGSVTLNINETQAPEMKEWIEKTLAPVLAEWYPKIVTMLPSKGFVAPKEIKLTIKPMDGVAFTVGKSITSNSGFLQQQIKGEAIGSLVHEEVHVAQQIKGYGGDNTPVWLVEGTADYIRWFKYEPQSHGADIEYFRQHKITSPHYDASYRITANFLNYVSEKYDKDIVAKLNAAMREGTYKEELWEQYTGKMLMELGVEWAKDVNKQLGVAPVKKEAAKPEEAKKDTK